MQYETKWYNFISDCCYLNSSKKLKAIAYGKYSNIQILTQFDSVFVYELEHWKIERKTMRKFSRVPLHASWANIPTFVRPTIVDYSTIIPKATTRNDKGIHGGLFPRNIHSLQFDRV